MKTVKIYYGEVLKKTEDLKTGACCTPDALPPHIREVMPLIAEEIRSRFYGCGSPMPHLLSGLRVLDLGCGTGRDAYVVSKLAGQTGFVYGLDMTENQIEVAIRYIDYQTDAFGYKRPNVAFIHDCIENIGRHFGPGSLDVVISNCVINLVGDKAGVIGQVYGALQEGGEFYFSDIYADRRLPEEVRKDPVLYAECLGGALYWRDFEGMAKKAGFLSARAVSRRRVPVEDARLKALVGETLFYSITYRLWKIGGLEETEEDYGQTATYLGGIEGAPREYALDADNIFAKGVAVRVSGNTALMLTGTRLKDYFEVTEGNGLHIGGFGGGFDQSRDEGPDANSGGCC